jgi:flagellar protein FliS
MMSNNAHEAYLESRILSADPVELVKILYQAAIGSVREARRHLENRDIAGRSRAITKAARILTELTVSLDRERGGDVSAGLGRLYDYMTRQLIEANMRQSDGPMEEVLGLLLTLAEGWDAVPATPKPEPKSESVWPQPIPEAAGSVSARAWSL